jgi:hypothetical protein
MRVFIAVLLNILEGLDLINSCDRWSASGGYSIFLIVIFEAFSIKVNITWTNNLSNWPSIKNWHQNLPITHRLMSCAYSKHGHPLWSSFAKISLAILSQSESDDRWLHTRLELGWYKIAKSERLDSQREAFQAWCKI